MGEMKNFEIVRTAFNGVTQVPDPTQIGTANEWWFLNHLSSSLLHYNHKENRFEPLLAESWSINENDYTLTLRNDIQFHDSTPITANDLISSLKRILIRKTSSHFPIWKYIIGCDKLRKISDECHGIEKINDHSVRFRLSQRSESLLLLFSSPEGGLWKSEDISLDASILDPKHFSGPYYLHGKNEDNLVLIKNKFNPHQKKYPFAPEKILVANSGGEKLNDDLKAGNIDAAIKVVRPLESVDFSPTETNRHLTIPNTIMYFFRIGKKKAVIGKDLLDSLWKLPLPKDVYSADTFLPFGSMGRMTREKTLEALPAYSTRKIRLAAVMNIYRPEFLSFIRERAKAVGIDIEEIEPIDFSTFYKWIKNPDLARNFDFILTNYVASERFPAVQLRFILHHHKPPYDLNAADLPETSPAREKLLHSVQTWMLKEQNVIPFYFSPTQIISKKELDLGGQPETDADIQLWLINSKLHL